MSVLDAGGGTLWFYTGTKHHLSYFSFNAERNITMSSKSEEWPDNLLLDMGVIPSHKPDERPDQMSGVEIALSSIPPREADMIRMVYQRHLTVTQAAQETGFSKQRASDILNKGREKMRNPQRIKLMCWGPEAVTTMKQYRDRIRELKAEIEALEEAVFELEPFSNRAREIIERRIDERNKAEAQQNIKKTAVGRGAKGDLDELELSPRAFNALQRGRILTIENLSKAKWDDLRKIRGMGIKSQIEIIDKAIDYGVKFEDRAIYSEFEHYKKQLAEEFRQYSKLLKDD